MLIHFTFQVLSVTLFFTAIGNLFTTHLDDVQSHDSHMTPDHTTVLLHQSNPLTVPSIGSDASHPSPYSAESTPCTFLSSENMNLTGFTYVALSILFNFHSFQYSSRTCTCVGALMVKSSVNERTHQNFGTVDHSHNTYIHTQMATYHL